MRAGALRCRGEIFSLSADLSVVSHGARWLGIRSKESADAQAPSGLRAPILVEVRARYSPLLQMGRYIRHSSRLLHITSVRDFKGDRSELVMSCEELVGECGQYRPADGMSRPCRVFLNPSAPYLDELGQVVDYRLLAEVALVETGRVQVDDQLQVAGQLYNVIAIANRGDDGVVRGLWLETVE